MSGRAPPGPGGDPGGDPGGGAEAGAGTGRAARLIDIADKLDGETVPLFLARQTYRHRRLMDAARLLPAVGLAAVMFPLLWLGEEEGPGTAQGVIYLFGVWFVLILAALVIARRLSGPLPREGRPEEAPGGEGRAEARAEGDDVV